MTRSKPFSGKQKKQQLQAKREKVKEAEWRRAQKDEDEIQRRLRNGDGDDAQIFDNAAAAAQVSTDVGFSGDLRTIFAKEPQWAVDERKKDATRALELAPDRGDSQSIYSYGLTDVSNQPPIPVRPHWTKDTGADALAAREEDAFRAWLTHLLDLCENHKAGAINAYERNLQVWRQLWRVIEKSNVLVHFADARCPLLHLSHALLAHIAADYPLKRVLIVLTKADFCVPRRLEAWVTYVRQRYRVPVVTYSRDRSEDDNLVVLEAIGALSRDTTCTAGRDDELNNGTLTVGLVGEPNVGKSSFLNGLFGKKLVSVSATPGHTKHFQTHFYEHPSRLGRDDVSKLCLCDCPGVVFPRFNIPMALQILFGSYPIAQTREPYSAIRFIAENCVPTLEATYKLKKVDEDDDWSPYTLAEAYAQQRGFHVKGGKLDVFRAANMLLRDTLNGKKVILSFPPPLDAAPDSL
ncbi:hypothetical protein SPRG_04529 [Saprolegnia parasitica CBS 223.65]|uniref:Guanine nucleotide-binding protein-like 1 n=1 Tax=Saprolegnia parasitica (strain CBS 223.65) TaxID=695850 RepID=A0A067CIS5_SAPPC|nr:hypothetical protein SPRG_04529 [Saprolegnia parasitica CBS 223.65]KDO30629.1 hypothetical protein SPRG_04529 [Saprolegnia parasitica CBS 223.65]|eukprot:XP_012198840.1 hypothetical protein SPRG_04529 [Saprolegnia parasitica CBS 223.65]